MKSLNGLRSKFLLLIVPAVFAILTALFLLPVNASAEGSNALTQNIDSGSAGDCTAAKTDGDTLSAIAGSDKVIDVYYAKSTSPELLSPMHNSGTDTGDSSNIILWLCILGASAVIVVIIFSQLISRHKKHRKRRK